MEQINIQFWTDKPDEMIDRLLKTLYNKKFVHKVSEISVFKAGRVVLGQKKWWQFWK